MSAGRVKTFRIGTPRLSGEGLRIAVTRYPQRGVSRERRAAEGCFDVWLPALAPSAGLLRKARAQGLERPAVRKNFFDRYERELLASAESRGTLELLGLIAARLPLSIGCFCEEESHCHRTRLREILDRFPLP